MRLIIFAGGVGTRLWPLSRENSPKQFDKIFSGRSTLELAADRVKNAFGIDNILIQTVADFKKDVREQVADLPEENIIIEPARRNVGPAVCLSTLELQRRGYDGPMAILWADQLMENKEEFIRALKAGEELIKEEPNRFVFLAEQPRFANNNLGWITVGKRMGAIKEVDYFSFKGWKYKPSAKECSRLFKSGSAYWNPGYFITSVSWLLEQYKSLAPRIYTNVLNGKYKEAEPVSFDNAIIEKVNLSNAVVIKTKMGWSDPGTLYALKEALEESREANVVEGNVFTLNTNDSLIYNLEKEKLVAVLGLKEMVVVNTPDALLVVPKDEVVHITDLVEKMKEEGRHKYL